MYQKVSSFRKKDLLDDPIVFQVQMQLSAKLMEQIYLRFRIYNHQAKHDRHLK